ncbi:MAG: insulinase family protein [Acidimicrobiaceae bacterium]|nr:insulinase family protein [Acidimicrobiaceae bacterium]
MDHSASRLTAALSRAGLVVALTAALLAALPSPVGAVSGYGDVSARTWYTDAVQWAVDNEITDISGPCFGPDAPVSRGEAAVWIHAMQGRPDPGAPHPFSDVTDQSQSDAISWMAHTGVTTGTSPTTFAPDELLKRGEAAAFLHRLAGEPSAPPHGFSDVVAPWQRAGVSWMAHTGVTTGTAPTTFEPEAAATRGQLVTFLYRYQGEPGVTVDAATPQCDPAEDHGEPEPDAAECEEVEAEDSESTGVEDGLLPVDPAVRIGTLENGLTYYLRCNSSPGGTLTLRLAVDAGSLHEAEVGSGVAHYLEHMLFNGTEKFPGNELTGALQRIGVEFGPDINAYTSYDETVYELDARVDDEDAVDTVFEVLAQWAHAATLNPDDVEDERGIVRDEYRLRYETGDGVIANAFDRIYVTGTPYEGRNPIGTIDNIETITARDLRDFYEKWYVPSNMAVIAVGDLPLDELEELVREHFDAIPAGEDPVAPETESALDPEPKYEIAASPGQGYSYLSLDVRLPSWDGGTVDGDRRLWIEQVIAIMLGNRLQDAYEQGYLSQTDPTHWSSFAYTEGLRYYGTNLRAEDYEQALTDFWSMMLTLAEHGFSDLDVARAVTAIESSLEFAVEAAPTIQNTSYASRYVSHFLHGADISTPADRLERVSALLGGLTPTELSDRLEEIMAESGLLVLGVAADAADLPTAEELSAAVEASEAGELPPVIEDADRLLEVPDPVEETEARELDVLDGAYEWTFPNGAVVVFAPSDIAENQVNLQAVSLGGWSAAEPGDRVLAGRLATRAVQQSGLGDLSPAQLSRYLDGINAAAQPFIGETTQGVNGSAGADDVETMFQLMHLLFTEPRVDDQALAEVVNIGEIILNLAQADPGWKAWVAYNRARYGDEFDWFNPVASQEILDELTAESLLERYKERFASVDDLTVVVVGDVDRETIERMARTYVGTLPSGDPDSYVNRRPPAPETIVRQEVDLGPDSQATALEVDHEVLHDVDPAVEVALDVLETILDARLVSDVREDIGATYSVAVSISTYFTPEQGIRSHLDASGDPERMEEIESEVFRILDGVAQGNVTPDEFTAAVAVVASNYERASNAGLIRPLARRAYAPDDQLPTPLRLVEELEQLELADVLALAKAIYGDGHYINIVRVLSPTGG